MLLLPEWKKEMQLITSENFILIHRKDTKLTVRHLPGLFSVTNGTDTEVYS